MKRHHVAFLPAGEAAEVRALASDVHAQAGVVVVVEWAYALRVAALIGPAQLHHVLRVVRRRIGQAVARLALAFGMKVLAQNPSPRTMSGVEPADLNTVLSKSDVVSLHCPLTDANRGFINEQTLSLMKPTAFLINTGRGPLVDEAALAAALRAGKLAGAGLDVLSVEPPPKDNPLLNCPNCFITPHIAWATRAARIRLYDIAVRNIEAFMAGKPQHVVNP